MTDTTADVVPMDMASIELYGRQNYEAYGDSRDWFTVSGEDMPAWEDQSKEIQAAWTNGASAVISSFLAEMRDYLRVIDPSIES